MKQLRTAVIKSCRKEDIDPDRPASEQKVCLYTHDGKRLLGRHPSAAAAKKQEAAIKARGGHYIRLAEVPEATIKSLYNDKWGAGIMKALGQDFPMDSKAAKFLFFTVWNAVIQLMDKVLSNQLKIDTTKLSEDPTFMQSLSGLAYFVTDDAIKSSLGLKSDSLQKGTGYAEALMQSIGQEADVNKTLQGLKQQALPIVDKAFDQVTKYLKEQPAEPAAKPAGEQPAAGQQPTGQQPAEQPAEQKAASTQMSRVEQFITCVAAKRGVSPKPCEIPGCEEKSVPGLKPGRGLCQYHYNKHQFGKEWADQCRDREKEEKPEREATADKTATIEQTIQQWAAGLPRDAAGPASVLLYDVVAMDAPATDWLRCAEAEGLYIPAQRRDVPYVQEYLQVELNRLAETMTNDTEAGRYGSFTYDELNNQWGLLYITPAMEDIVTAYSRVPVRDSGQEDEMATDKRDAAKGENPWIGFKKLPKGWTDKSLEKWWGKLAGGKKDKVEACIKKMKDHMDDPEAFCAAAYDELERAKGVKKPENWRGKKKAEANTTPTFRHRGHLYRLATEEDLREARRTSRGPNWRPRGRDGDAEDDEMFDDAEEPMERDAAWGRVRSAQPKQHHAGCGCRDRGAAKGENPYNGWKGEPHGWDKKSNKKFWDSVGGSVDKCIAKMKGQVDDPGAFCAGLKDEIEGKETWRGKGKKGALDRYAAEQMDLGPEVTDDSSKFRGFNLNVIPEVATEALAEIKSDIDNFYNPYDEYADYWVETLLNATGNSEDYVSVLGIDPEDPEWQEAVREGFDFEYIDDVIREIDNRINDYMQSRDIPGSITLGWHEGDGSFGLEYHIGGDELEDMGVELPARPANW